MSHDKGLSLYLKYAFSGALCCCITHSAVVPIDVVKTRMQSNPGLYESLIHGVRTIYKTEGFGMLYQGLGPTAVGYFIQGALKFGFYEFFKHKYALFVGPEYAEKYRIPIWLAAGGSAEVLADIGLCPLEATRVRLVADPSFARGLPDAITRIVRQEGFWSLYKGMPPILLKQVPYTMAKFGVFEWVSDTIYRVLQKAGKPKSELSDGTKLFVSFNSGIIAGLVAAIVSQPADTVFTKINQKKINTGMIRAIIDIMKELGAKNLFLGLKERCVMVATLTAGQFFIYDGLKQLMGIAKK